FQRAREALDLDPRLRAGRWNLALALRAMGLSLSAARELEVVGSFREPGWADEARQLHDQFQQDVDRQPAARGEANGRRFGQLAQAAAARGRMDLAQAYEGERLLLESRTPGATPP